MPCSYLCCFIFFFFLDSSWRRRHCKHMQISLFCFNMWTHVFCSTVSLKFIATIGLKYARRSVNWSTFFPSHLRLTIVNSHWTLNGQICVFVENEKKKKIGDLHENDMKMNTWHFCCVYNVRIGWFLFGNLKGFPSVAIPFQLTLPFTCETHL